MGSGYRDNKNLFAEERLFDFSVISEHYVPGKLFTDTDEFREVVRRMAEFSFVVKSGFESIGQVGIAYGCKEYSGGV